ncbi:Sr-Related And Ctd-Associated Factor 8 [Manis pentadactyla]|nr:Sr-Related And Ctd-Associated Factor 8 [Manis pentadactyla]
MGLWEVPYQGTGEQGLQAILTPEKPACLGGSSLQTVGGPRGLRTAPRDKHTAPGGPVGIRVTGLLGSCQGQEGPASQNLPGTVLDSSHWGTPQSLAVIVPHLDPGRSRTMFQ